MRYINLLLLLCALLVGTSANAQRKYYDAMAFGFWGHVKTAKAVSTGAEKTTQTWEFRSDGSIKSVNGIEIPTSLIKREKGKLVGIEGEMAFEYNSLGIVQYTYLPDRTYESIWSNNKRLTGTILYNGDGEPVMSLTVNVQAVDSYGNHTKRKVTVDQEYGYSSTVISNYTYWQ